MGERGKANSDLRRRAEARVGEARAQSASLDEVEARRLVSELRVHQIELEIQNEELERSRAETESHLARYAELFDFAPIGFLHVGPDGKIRASNFAAARLMKTDRKALVGRTLSTFLGTGPTAQFEAFLARALSSLDEPSHTIEVPLFLAGDELWVRVTAAPLDGGPEATALVAVEDITARRQGEETLRAETRHKDEFLAALSHELRNPLAPIRNAIALLQRLPAGSEKASAALAVLDRQVLHLTRLVDDLLDLTRVARGKIRLERERLELGELVRRTVEDHRAGFEAKGVVLSYTLPRPLFIEGDASRLAQAVGNLLGNALKFTNPGDTVLVSLEGMDGRARLAVTDSGVGIAPELVHRLFEPFSQGPQTIDRSRGGLGLGLATVKGLVELLGGSVGATSGGPGHGSEFVIWLPLVDGPRSGSLRRAAGPARPVRVLVVEDSSDAAMSLKELLELRGHDVRVAFDGRRAIFTARAFHPEIVLCDLGLPGMTGFDVAAALRSEEPISRALLVALSGYASPEDVRRAEEAGFDRHLAKPATPEDLDRLLAEAIRRPGEQLTPPPGL